MEMTIKMICEICDEDRELTLNEELNKYLCYKCDTEMKRDCS